MIEAHGPKSEQLRLCVSLLHTEITKMAATFPLSAGSTAFQDGLSSLMS